MGSDTSINDIGKCDSVDNKMVYNPCMCDVIFGKWHNPLNHLSDIVIIVEVVVLHSSPAVRQHHHRFAINGNSK